MKTHPAVRPASSRGLALFLHAGLPLAFGSAVYLFARPEPPHVVQWILASLSELGLTLQPLFGASRITAVFPDAAWSYALTATLVVIWRDASYDRARAWAVVGGAVGVLWELSQALGIIAGSFDLADLIASVVASFFAWLACRRSRPAPNAQLSPEPIA